MHEDQGGQAFEYACQQWCYHLSLVISHQVTVGEMNTHGGIKTLMERVKKGWLKTWMYGLKNLEGLETVCQNCESALQKIGASCIQRNSLAYLLMTSID